MLSIFDNEINFELMKIFKIPKVLFCIVQIVLSSAQAIDDNFKNFEKFNLNTWQPMETLKVSAINYEPFIYRNKNGEFASGIEYQLIKMIADKEHLNLSIEFHDQFKSFHFNQLLFK